MRVRVLVGFGVQDHLVARHPLRSAHDLCEPHFLELDQVSVNRRGITPIRVELLEYL